MYRGVIVNILLSYCISLIKKFTVRRKRMLNKFKSDLWRIFV